jgi:DNA-binding SARP family transcriptional activator/pimeloyl-ACP methyl ester carboxylesterase
LDFQVLGPLQVLAQGEALRIGGPRARGVLALLLAHPNQVISAGALIDELWPGRNPERAAASLHVRVAELRAALRDTAGDVRLLTRGDGYVLHAAPEELDASRFEALFSGAREAYSAGDPAATVRLLDAGLALWRGPAFAEVADLQLVRAESVRLEEIRLDAIELSNEAKLACGRHLEVLSTATALTGSHPLRERLWAQRMLALYRAGRQAEALSCYRELRAVLVDQVGIEPSGETRELQLRMLRQDPSLEAHLPAPGQVPVAAERQSAPQAPPTQYVRSGSVHIAYQVLGEGGADILFVPGLISHLDLCWQDPVLAQFFRRLAAFGRVILFDKRDTGLSDPAPDDAPLEQRMDDLRAVLDACGSRRALLVGYSEGGAMSLLFAATYPDRVTALVLASTSARWASAPGYPCGQETAAMVASLEQMMSSHWGRGDSIEWFAPSRAGSAGSRESMGRWERMSASPGAALRLLRMCAAIDVRAILPAVHVPAIVYQRLGDRITPPCHGRYLAGHLADARYLEQPGDHVLWTGDTDALLEQIAQLVTLPARDCGSDHILTTILIAGLEPPVDTQGGRSGQPHLATYAGSVRESIDRYGGRAAEITAQRLLATFDGPARAIRCADVLRGQAADAGITIRVGIHSGEIAAHAPQVTGISADIAGRIAALAQPGEILVSRTVKDLVVGAGIPFADRGSHDLTASADRWTVFSVLDT